MTSLSLPLSLSIFFLSCALVSADAWTSFSNLSGCHFGDSRPEIISLKSYLRKFGYLPSLSSNLSDSPCFDESLRAAILSYQENFHLNLTGDLDFSTLDLMTRPRCGVADVSNSSSVRKIHGRGLYSFFPGRPRWRRNHLTYSIQNSNRLPSREVREIFSRAFSRWSAVTPLTFSEVDRQADIRIGFFSGEHGDGEGFDGVLGTLAHAFAPPDGRLHLDADERWSLAGFSDTAVDLESVAVHEIGHVLGLGHSTVPQSIMFPTIRVGRRRLELDNDDVAGIQDLYGRNPSSNESGQTPRGPATMPETSGDAGDSVFLVGMAMVAALMASYSLIF